METLAQINVFAFPIALFIGVFGVLARLWRVLHYRYGSDLGAPGGDDHYGAFYALTFAMLPWKKESTRTHWATYTAGMLMHIGIFGLFAFGATKSFGVEIGLLTWAVRTVVPFCAILSVGLLIKRLTIANMRAVSTLDDYLSNILVDLFMLGGILTAWDATMVELWRVSTILLLLWMPLGKIFHMVLFFVSRVLFGWQFGRRGVIRRGLPISY